MCAANDNELKALVRERFTRTAEVFGDYAVAHRVTDAELLVRLVSAGPNDRAVDLACGAGTLALRFARHVRWVCGLDFTPAILARTRINAIKQGLANLVCVLGDAQALPLGDGSARSCGHELQPAPHFRSGQGAERNGACGKNWRPRRRARHPGPGRSKNSRDEPSDRIYTRPFPCAFARAERF